MLSRRIHRYIGLVLLFPIARLGRLEGDRYREVCLHREFLRQIAERFCALKTVANRSLRRWRDSHLRPG